MTEEAFVSGENISEEQKKHMDLTEQAYEEYNFSKLLQPDNVLGIKREEIIEGN
jgi:hypothetical protein